MPHSAISILMLVALLLAACGQPAAPGESGDVLVAAGQVQGELVVFAAASLTEAFTELGSDFETAHPGVTVLLNFAGSQQLAQQLAQGAPADVFASANMRQMDVAIEAGRVEPGTTQIFARNRLVVVTPADNPGAVNTLQDLANPGLRLILAAEDVPVGAYSRTYLDKAEDAPTLGEDYHDAVLANVVSYEQTVKAVLTKVVLGEADVGIVYTSDITGEAVQQVQQIDIPDALNTIATYPIAPISDSAQPELARLFIDYVRSPEGQATLTNQGFLPAE